MGRIVNPIGSRAGKTTLWRDSWVVKNLYYSELFLKAMKTKEYLDGMLTDEKFERLIGFHGYSHLDFKNNCLNINTFIYVNQVKDDLRGYTRYFPRFFNSWQYKRFLSRFLVLLVNRTFSSKFIGNVDVFSFNKIDGLKFLFIFNMFLFSWTFEIRRVYGGVKGWDAKYYRKEWWKRHKLNKLNNKFSSRSFKKPPFKMWYTKSQRRRFRRSMKKLQASIFCFYFHFLPNLLTTNPELSLATVGYFFKIMFKRRNGFLYGVDALKSKIPSPNTLDGYYVNIRKLNSFWSGSSGFFWNILFRQVFYYVYYRDTWLLFYNKLAKNIFKITGYPVKFALFALHNLDVNAAFMARYMARRFVQHYRLTELLTPIKRELNSLLEKDQILWGYKLHFRGRFNRRQRKTSLWVRRGKVPLNSLSTHFDYGYEAVSLRNSVCSIKVWLNRKDEEIGERVVSYRII